jgi:hypothetical protein
LGEVKASFMQELDPESIDIGPGFGLVLLLQEKITIAVIQNIIEREIRVLIKGNY